MRQRRLRSDWAGFVMSRFKWVRFLKPQVTDTVSRAKILDIDNMHALNSCLSETVCCYLFTKRKYHTCVLLLWHTVGQGPAVLAAGAGRMDFFLLLLLLLLFCFVFISSILSSFSS